MMRRGMVLKLKNDYAIIATDDSDFIRVKYREGMRVGQKIFVFDEDVISSEEKYKKSSNTLNYLKVVAVLAACIAIAVIINNPFIRNVRPLYAMVSLDINPSFELGIDEAYNVVQIDAINEESKGILDTELIGKPLSVAVSKILSDVEKSGYVLPSNNDVLVSTVNFKNNDDEPLQKIVADGVSLAMSKNAVYESTKVIFIEADEEDLEAAEKQNLSVGKYRLLEMSDNKIDKKTITEGRVSDLIKEEEIKDDLETDKTIQIIDGEDLKKVRQIQEDIDRLEDAVKKVQGNLDSDDVKKIEKLLDDIERMENHLLNEESEFERIHKAIEKLRQSIESKKDNGLNKSYKEDNQPLYAMVSFDINPSFELGIDEAHKVVRVKAMNEESKEIVDEELIGESLEIAVTEILYNLEELGYVLASNNAVLVSIVNFKGEDDEPLQKIVADAVRLAISDYEVDENTKVIFVEADKEDLEAAGKQKLSVGKYRLFRMSNKKIDKRTIMRSRVSDLIKKKELKTNLENDESTQIVDGEDLKELNEIEEDIENIKDTVEEVKDRLDSDDLKEIENLFDDIYAMENQLINEEPEFQKIHDTIEKLEEIIEMEEIEDIFNSYEEDEESDDMDEENEESDDMDEEDEESDDMDEEDEESDDMGEEDEELDDMDEEDEESDDMDEEDEESDDMGEEDEESDDMDEEDEESDDMDEELDDMGEEDEESDDMGEEDEESDDMGEEDEESDDMDEEDEEPEDREDEDDSDEGE